MAFENIDVTSLKLSLNSFKSTINYSITNLLIDYVVNNDLWYCDSRLCLRKALYNLKRLYQDLEKNIDNYLTVATMIEDYKTLQSDNNNLREERERLTSQLWRDEEYTELEYNAETESYDEVKKWRRVKDSTVENRIFEIDGHLHQNEERMSQLYYKINIY